MHGIRCGQLLQNCVVCLLRHNHEHCKNGRINWDAIWGGSDCSGNLGRGPGNHVLGGVGATIPPREGAIGLCMLPLGLYCTNLFSHLWYAK